VADALTLSGTSFAWPGEPALFDGLSLEIPQGSFTAVVGPSGCGKSTLLRLMAGLLAPSAGRVTGVHERRAMVFQSPTLLAWRTVRENVALPLELAGLEGDVDAALDLVGLADDADTLPRALSGGMRMRVSLARALVVAPRPLLLDEPLSALDALTRRRLQRDLLALWRRFRFTAVLVTHDVDEAVLMADRVLVLDTARPVSVRADQAISLPRPRGPAAAYDPVLVEHARALEALL